MANRVMIHLLGYNYNLHTGIGDQLKTLNAHEIWNYLLFSSAYKFGQRVQFGLRRSGHFKIRMQKMVAHVNSYLYLRRQLNAFMPSELFCA